MIYYSIPQSKHPSPRSSSPVLALAGGRRQSQSSPIKHQAASRQIGRLNPTRSQDPRSHRSPLSKPLFHLPTGAIDLEEYNYSAPLIDGTLITQECQTTMVY